MENKGKGLSPAGWIIGVLLLVYLGVFCYLNLCKYAQHVDSDIAAEALLAREIWEEKDISPDDWVSSTERRIIGMSAVASVFYGITGSMQLAVGLACVLLGAVLLGTFYFFLRKISLGRTASLAALLVLCALPANGWRNEGQMVPFVILLLFLFAEYYVFHGIFFISQYSLLSQIAGKPEAGPQNFPGVVSIVCGGSFVELWRAEVPAGHHTAAGCGGGSFLICGIRIFQA